YSGRGFFARAPSRNFFIVDWQNNRVLAFDELPTSPTQVPQAVLGQTVFTGNAATAGPSGLSAPRGAWSDGAQLYVADSDNNRVLTFNLPLTSGQMATAVIGQADFTGNLPNRSVGPNNNTLYTPSGLCVVDNGATRQLFVADMLNSRVLRFTNGAA